LKSYINKKTKCLKKHPSNHIFAPCKLHHMYGIIRIKVECQDLSQAIKIDYEGLNKNVLGDTI